MAFLRSILRITTVLAFAGHAFALPATMRETALAADGTTVPAYVMQTQAAPAVAAPMVAAAPAPAEEESGFKKALPFIAIAGLVGLGCMAVMNDSSSSQLQSLATDMNNTFEADARTRPSYQRNERGETSVDNSPPETPIVRDELDKYISEKIDKELFDKFDSAKDAELFCPKYRTLNRKQKVEMWTTLNTAVIQYESGWRPTDRMKERGFKPDPITGQQVYSEGLYALSYQDQQSYPFCKFNWEADKQLKNRKDPRNSILDPKINIDCGLRILAQKIHNDGRAVVKHCRQNDPPPCAYWSVLAEPKTHGNSKVNQITQLTKRLPFCN